MTDTPLTLFLPCAGGVEDYLADEVHGLTGLQGEDLLTLRGGVRLRANWACALRLNLHSRLAQRVLIELAHGPCQDEHQLYALTIQAPWEAWFTPQHTFRVDITAQASPLRSLNFATLRVKDAVADRFRAQTGGQRPSINTHAPDVRVSAHLTSSSATLYIDTSGEPLFKRGWRQDKGDAPLKETLAAAMLAACGWWQPATRQLSPVPLYDPCCGSGTIVIEAAQLLLGLPPGGQRRFAFERLHPYQSAQWNAIRKEAPNPLQANEGSISCQPPATPRIFGSDVAHRMVDFAQRNAQRAGVATAIGLRGGDALQRLPPSPAPGLLLLNPPYGERITAAGVAGRKSLSGGRETFQSAPLARQRAEATPAYQRRAAPPPGGRPTSANAWPPDSEANTGDEFFARLAAHWKSHYADWTAWLLTPDTALPSRLRLKATRRVPLWNGPIECRLLRFDLSARQTPPTPSG